MFFVPAAVTLSSPLLSSNLRFSSAQSSSVTYKGGNQYLYSNIDEDAMFDILFPLSFWQVG